MIETPSRSEPVPINVYPALIDEARQRLRGIVRPTRVVQVGPSLFVKCETEQVTGSFKARGAFNALLSLNPAHVVVGSSGNHGLAVARAGRLVRTRAHVVMTEDVRASKRRAVERAGAEVVICGRGSKVRARVAADLAAELGALVLSSYDHPLVIAGQGTVGSEIVEQLPTARVVFVPVGGGGLAAGTAVAVKTACPQTLVVGVEPDVADDTLRSLRNGIRSEIDPPTTVCDGVCAQTPGELTFPIMQSYLDGVISVPESDIGPAMRMLADHGIRAEPTGALALAGALRCAFPGGPALAVASGSNIDADDFARLTGVASNGARSTAQDHRKAYAGSDR
jgi:threonine dehydratase